MPLPLHCKKYHYMLPLPSAPLLVTHGGHQININDRLAQMDHQINAMMVNHYEHERRLKRILYGPMLVFLLYTIIIVIVSILKYYAK